MLYESTIGCLRETSYESNHPGRLARAIIIAGRNKYGSGSNFILPVMPEIEVQGMEREQLKFKLNSSTRATK